MVLTLQMVGLVVTGVLTIAAFWLLRDLRKDAKTFSEQSRFNKKK